MTASFTRKPNLFWNALKVEMHLISDGGSVQQLDNTCIVRGLYLSASFGIAAVGLSWSSLLMCHTSNEMKNVEPLQKWLFGS